MRNVKYRIWCPVNKVFFYWERSSGPRPQNFSNKPFLGKHLPGLVALGVPLIWEELNSFNYKYHNDYIWQIKLDLRDVNGKDIYEGDIVKITLKSDEHGDYETHISEIIYENDAFGDKYDTLFNYRQASSFSIEVLGNIYQNAELLK